MTHAAVTAPSVSLRRFGAVEASDVHDFHQVVLGLDGAMVMAVDGVAQQIDARSAWLVPAGARHDARLQPCHLRRALRAPLPEIVDRLLREPRIRRPAAFPAQPPE